MTLVASDPGARIQAKEEDPGLENGYCQHTKVAAAANWQRSRGVAVAELGHAIAAAAAVDAWVAEQTEDAEEVPSEPGEKTVGETSCHEALAYLRDFLCLDRRRTFLVAVCWMHLLVPQHSVRRWSSLAADLSSIHSAELSLA